MPTQSIGGNSFHSVSASAINIASRNSEVVYRNAAQVRARYSGVSDMSLWRWLHDEELGFPQPIRINGRRFWREQDLIAWERTRVPDELPSPDRPTTCDDAESP